LKIIEKVKLPVGLKDSDLLVSLVGVGVTGYELVYLCGEKLFHHSLGSLKDYGGWQICFNQITIM
jgi:hypothetical protein